MKFWKVIISVSAIIGIGFADNREYCTTTSCVHASASIIEKLDTDLDPCDDFYEFACANFANDFGVPDEKTTIDTLALITDRVLEYLLTLLEKESGGSDEPKPFTLSKTFYHSCMDTTLINEIGKKPLLDLLEVMGGWPMVSGTNWNESAWDWDAAILNMRKSIGKKKYNIFETKKSYNEIDLDDSNFNKEDMGKVEENLKQLIRDSVELLAGVQDEESLYKEIDELIEFEKKLDDLQKMHNYAKASKVNKKLRGLKKLHMKVLWMNYFQASLIANNSRYEGALEENISEKYLAFLENTPKRVLANYVSWRVVSISYEFLDQDFRDTALRFAKSAQGKEDFEQRWKFCTTLVTKFASVAVGSLYISEYFRADDKKAADEVMKYIFDAYKEIISESTWITDGEKKKIFDYTDNMLKFIGYHVKLVNESHTFYNGLANWDQKHFFQLGMALKIFNTDREFKQLFDKTITADWTKYSQPATVNAFYSSKDRSIQFPAGILQDPNFDKDRPNFMNLGAIGSIIGHEITHSFDFIAMTFTNERKIYDEKVQCIIDQYSSYRVPEIESYFNIAEFHLNGNFSQKEDIADNGGVKLSYRAYRNWLKDNDIKQSSIGLHKFTTDKLFFIVYAQTFCSSERPTQSKNKVESGKYSLERFRVNGPLSNLPEFERAFNCSASSKMVRNIKCNLW